MTNQNIDVLWDDNPVDITSEAKFYMEYCEQVKRSIHAG